MFLQLVFAGVRLAEEPQWVHLVTSPKGIYADLPARIEPTGAFRCPKCVSNVRLPLATRNYRTKRLRRPTLPSTTE